MNLSRSYFVIDGISRYGFEVTGHTWAGVQVSGDNVTLQYLHIHHNPPNPSGGDIFGIRTSVANNFTIRNCEINDNGQDAIQSILGGDNVLLEGNYIHSHNYNHPDALQQQGGNGLVVRNNVITDGFMQGIFLGENSNRSAWNTNVEIYNNLLYDYDYGIKTKNTNTQDFDIHHNTFANLNNFAIEWCCASPGARAPMLIHDNIFYKTSGFYLNTGDGTTTFSDNCMSQSGYVSGNVTVSGTILGDPRFVDADNGDFALQPGSPCAGKGSSITSLASLYALDGEPTPTDTPPTDTPVPPTDTPVPTDTPIPTLPGLSWAATAGTVTLPFLADEYIYQTTQTLDPTLGGKATYLFSVETLGEYIITMSVNAPDGGSNSIFINIDNEPDTGMIWDIPVTQGFQDRTVSWRGNGTPDVAQFEPKVFTLSDGQHELVIRGREAGTEISNMTLVLAVVVPPTDTPMPPTDTPIPPTDTPVPPTDTPVPPTDTPIPPTDTPTPMPTRIPLAELQAMFDGGIVFWTEDGVITIWQWGARDVDTTTKSQ